METPLVSVCMTTYNHEPYIAEAIESVLAQQTSFGVELVVGEDCSTDRTAAICREYAAKYPDRIRLVTSPENVGWRANYRRTFEACRGKYVAYLDGDDWWCDPRKLQMQADLMESDPGCGMCYTRASNYWQASDRTEPDHPDHYTDFGRLLCSLTIANCATLARRELIARYYDEVRPAEHPEWKTDDAPMWLWFSVRSRISYLPDITAVHRRLPDSVSHSTAYRKRIAFCDSLMDISLWFDARYGAGRNRFRILRRRSSVALWVLSWEGPVGEYVTRWRRDVAACPRLALCPEGPGLLAGGLATGFVLATMLNNAGGAWDNAKKYIENGAHGGKKLPDGSKNPTHGAAVIGDTVGDPCKDTSGPALNILIKLMSMVCIVFAPVFIKFSPMIQGWFGINGILQ